MPVAKALLLLVLSVQPGDGPREIFAAYRSALLADDGNAAAAAVSEATFAYFGDIAHLAVCGTPGDVTALSPVDRMQVVMLRHRVPTGRLATMSGRDTFIYAVEHGWVGKGGIASADLGEVSVDGNVATAGILINGQPAPGATFQFKNEDGRWKLDVVAALSAGNAVLQQLARRQEIEEDSLILELVGRVTGTRPPSSIWEPVAPEHERCTAGQPELE